MGREFGLGKRSWLLFGLLDDTMGGRGESLGTVRGTGSSQTVRAPFTKGDCEAGLNL